MNEKLAIKILKQASLETTVGACEKCPRKDKNKTCIGCLDNAKCILLNYIDNLQSKIDKAIDKINQYELIVGYYDSNYDEYDDTYSHEIKEELLDILKEVDK